MTTRRFQATREPAAALAPAWVWLRLDLRRRWRSLTVLALLVALASGTVMAAAAGARRGGSAVDRLWDRTLPATTAVLPNDPGFDWEPVRELPGVAAVGTLLLAEYLIEGIPDAQIALPFGDFETMRTVERPVVLAGRMADPARADEAVVTAEFLTGFDRELGDTVTARLYTPEEADRSFAGEEVTPTGPRQPLRIVGVVRSGWFSDEAGWPGEIVTTAAFTGKYRANLMGAENSVAVNALVRLADGETGLPAFRQEFAELTGRTDIEFMNWAAEARNYEQVTAFERNALLAFALAGALAAVVLLGQAVARYTSAAAADLRVLRTLGLSARQAVLAAAAGPALAALAGAAVGAAAAVSLSPLFPIGGAAYVEPDPGVDADLAVLAGVGGVVVLGVVVVAAAVAWRTPVMERDAATPSRSSLARAAYRLGLPVPVVVGTRFALEPGRGRAAVPVRPALVGAVVGVLGVLAALTFRAGVVDAAANPARFGQTFQLVGFSGFEGFGFDGEDETSTRPVQEAWARDPDVVAINDTRVGVATVGTTSVTVFSYDPVDGRALPVVTLSGRMPTGPDEIALAPTSARDTGAAIGDVVTVAGRDRADARLRVTGTVFVPEDSHTGYAEGGWVTAEGYRNLFADGYFKYHETHLALRPGADVAAVAERLTTTMVEAAGGPVIGLNEPITPEEIGRIRSVRVLPLALGMFLGLLAAGATGHALATAVRRRRHDMAVLRALGITRWQSRLVVVTQAVTLAVVGLALGVPLGVALGRTVWRAVAESTPVLYVPPLAVVALAVIGPVVLLVGNLLAALPARRAARLRVGDVLRAE